MKCDYKKSLVVPGVSTYYSVAIIIGDYGNDKKMVMILVFFLRFLLLVVK